MYYGFATVLVIVIGVFMWILTDLLSYYNQVIIDNFFCCGMLQCI